MNVQIVLVGYDKEAKDKLLVVETNCEGEGEDCIDSVSFPNYNITVDRRLLLDVIEFLRTH